MPAEIDTGRPRVLHCVERADCPIPRAPPILSSPSPTSAFESNLPSRRSRLRRCRSSRNSSLLATSAEPWIIPGNDERDQFLRDERSATVSTTSSNDLVERGALRHPRRRKPQDNNVMRRRKNRENRLCDEINVRIGNSICGDNEISQEEITPFYNTRQTPIQSAATSTYHLIRVVPKNRQADNGESSAIVIRLFDGCGGCGSVESKRESVYPTLPAAISSQRDRPPEITDPIGYPVDPLRDDDETREYCVECAWQCESECVCDYPSDELKSARNSDVKVTRERRKRFRHMQHKGRSYLQLALLLFLLAFGHNSFVKSYSGGFGGSFGVGAGIGALTIGTFVGTVRAVPIDLDAGVRAERSANLSHITGVSRKIQMYIKNRHLQILPDGSVNGSNDDTSEYTIFQRTSVSRGQLRIQGVATCLYLCMDSCGLLYGSREYTDDCVFNETLEQHNYNSYSSVRWSTAKKTLYLGLNRWGQPRRVQAKGHNLGRLSAYARVLTQVAPADRVEALQARMLGAQHNLRHHHNSHHHRNMQQTICPSLPPQEKDGRDKFRCRKRKKRKKRKRHCHKGEKPGPQCEVAEEHRGGNAEVSGEGPPQSKRSCEGAASEELCRKQALDAPAKKRKSRIEPIKSNGENKEKQQRNRGKEVRPKSPDNRPKKSNSAGEKDEDSSKKSTGPNGGKRKRPLSKQRPGVNKKKVSGRVTRTSVAADPNAPVPTLPTSWYPGASTTLSTEPIAIAEVTSWRRTKTAASPKNDVTSGDLKISNTETTRNGKGLETLGILTDSFVTESSIESDDLFASVNDSSAETSEEAKSDESTLEDDLMTSSAEYSTIMTTMDTTPPERTEDYSRITTPAMQVSGEIDGGFVDEFQNSFGAKSGGTRRLAM